MVSHAKAEVAKNQEETIVWPIDIEMAIQGPEAYLLMTYGKGMLRGPLS